VLANQNTSCLFYYFNFKEFLFTFTLKESGPLIIFWATAFNFVVVRLADRCYCTTFVMLRIFLVCLKRIPFSENL
jgi:hypothetical protein